MFFERITKFSLFLKKEQNSSSSEITLFSQGSTSRKETFFFLRFSEAQPTLGASALLLTLQESLSPVCTLSPEHGCKVKAFLHKTYGEKGKRTETCTKESAAMEEWECSLWGQHTAQQDWSQHPPHTPTGNLGSVPASLTEQCFPETVKGQISDFLSMLVKRLEYKCKFFSSL